MLLRAIIAVEASSVRPLTCRPALSPEIPRIPSERIYTEKIPKIPRVSPIETTRGRLNPFGTKKKQKKKFDFNVRASCVMLSRYS